MSHDQFSDEIEIAEEAEELGKQALKLGLIPSFVVHYCPDIWRFYIPDQSSAPLTSEEAYKQLRRLVELSAL